MASREHDGANEGVPPGFRVGSTATHWRLTHFKTKWFAQLLGPPKYDLDYLQLGE